MSTKTTIFAKNTGSTLLSSGFQCTYSTWSCHLRYDYFIFACCVTTLLVSLGLWQWNKAFQPPKTPPEISLRIETAPKHHILLENQPHEAKLGYRVLMVTESPTLPSWILVDRGWIPRGQTRDPLPVLEPLSVPFTIKGHFYKAWKNPFMSQPSDTLWTPEAPLIRVQKLDLDYLEQLWQHPIEPHILKLSHHSEGVLTPLAENQHLTPERHLGYAVQWFGLSIAFIVCSIAAGVRWKKT